MTPREPATAIPYFPAAEPQNPTPLRIVHLAKTQTAYAPVFQALVHTPPRSQTPRDPPLEYTRMNKELLGADNVTVIKSDILESSGFLGLPRPDIILSNPPYIKTAEVSTLQPEIAFEPSLALDGGEDGLTFYRALSEIWYPFINRGGYLAMECGEEQAKDILSLFVDKAEKGKVIKDAADLDRVVVIAR